MTTLFRPADVDALLSEFDAPRPEPIRLGERTDLGHAELVARVNALRRLVEDEGDSWRFYLTMLQRIEEKHERRIAALEARSLDRASGDARAATCKPSASAPVGCGSASPASSGGSATGGDRE